MAVNVLGSMKPVNWGKITLQGGKRAWTAEGSQTFSGQAFRQRFSNFFRKFGDAVALGMCLRFSVAAAKFTPPKNRGKWTGTIEDSLYFRPIQDLRLLAKGMYPRCHASREDYQMLRQGYLFRVMNTKYRHKRQDAVVGYARGINEAKRMSRIQNRGISKYSWGSLFSDMTKKQVSKLSESLSSSDIGKVGEPLGVAVYKVNKLPPIFQRLAKKSPNITKFHWGEYDWKYKPNKKQPTNMDIEISNRLTEIERYGQIAVGQGLKSAVKYAEKVWKAVNSIAAYRGIRPKEQMDNVTDQRKIVEGLRQMLAKLFEDDARKRDIQQLQLERMKPKQRIKGDVHIIMKGSSIL